MSQGIEVDCIAGDSMKTASIVSHPNVCFHNFRGSQNTKSPAHQKIYRVLKYYVLLLTYVTTTKAALFHIQWPNKFIYFDRTVLNIYYKLLGKKGLVMPDEKPKVDVAYIKGDIGYRYHDGGHTDVPDWPAFFEFAKKRIK